MKTLMILAEAFWSDERIIGVIAFLGIGFGLYVLNKIVSGKPFEASDETNEDKEKKSSSFELSGQSEMEKGEKPSSDKTEDTKENTFLLDDPQEEILKQLKAIKWILAIGFLYLMAVISGLIPAGVFS